MKNIILLLNAGDTRIAVLENISSLAIVQKIIFKYIYCTFTYWAFYYTIS